MLRALYRLLTLAALLVGAGVVLPTGGSTYVLATVREVAAVEGASTESSWQTPDDESGEAPDLRVVESDDDDDDDDPFCDIADGSALAFRVVPSPPRPERARHRGISVDTSRYAAGTGLPRGPPSARV